MLVALQYRPHNSLIERFDPRARWFFSLLMMLAITQFMDVRILIFFFLVSIVHYLLTRLTWKETRRAWLVIFLLLFVVIFVNTIITSSGTIGEVMLGSHPVLTIDTRFPVTGWPIQFTLTEERLWFALAQFLRILSIAMLFVVIPYTMDPRTYGITFRGMGLPDRFAYTIDLAFRFIPTLNRDFNLTMDAQRARGYEIERGKGGLIAQTRRVAPLIIPVTMNSILTGEDIANAMDLRCFGLRARTWIQTLKYQWYDYALIGFAVVVVIASFILRFGFQVGGFWMPG